MQKHRKKSLACHGAPRQIPACGITKCAISGKILKPNRGLNYADKEKRNKENQDSGKTLWIKTVTNGICGDANAIKITLERYVKLVRAAGGDVRV